MAVNIIAPVINVNSLNTNANIANGENLLSGWDSHNKNNYGNGTLFGLMVSNNINYVIDNDVIDTPINDQDSTPSSQGQSV